VTAGGTEPYGTGHGTGPIADIEVLRALAIAVVALSHYPVLFFWGAGETPLLAQYVTLWSGVDLFFAVSGFVIARDLLRRLETAAAEGTFRREAGAFWLRRVFRIWPSAWLWLGIGLAGTVAFNRSGAFGELWSNALDTAAAVLQAANLYFYACAWKTIGCGKNWVYWSLSLEEQFYILLPLAFLLLRRRLGVALAVLAASQILLPRPLWSFGWAIRTDAILLGVLLAMASHHALYRRLEPTFLARRLLGVPVLLALVAGLLVLPNSRQFQLFEITPIGTGMLALVSAALVFVASFDADYLLRPGRLRTAALWVGTRSYAIYLIHERAFALTREIWTRLCPADTVFDARFAVPFVVTAALLTVGLSELNHRLVETPFRCLGRRLSDRMLRPAPVRRSVAAVA
jgi:peptidoglycan/LPS O-acetylase OafA/YrhL